MIQDPFTFTTITPTPIPPHPIPHSIPLPSLPPPSAMICPCVKNGYTPLHRAARWGDDDKCVQVLIEAGADLEAKDDVREE